MDIEQLYRHDIKSIPDWRGFSEQEKSDILARAKEGHTEAKHTLVGAMLPCILAYAVKLQNGFVDVMDLIGVGNTTLIERIDKALLDEPNPCGYILKFAYGEMLQYRKLYSNAITLPSGPGHDPHIVLSILDELDIDNFDIPEPPTTTTQEADTTPIYEALDILPNDKARDIMMRLYGLDIYTEQDMCELAGTNSTTKEYGALKARKLLYLKKIRQYLETNHLDYVKAHTRPATNKTSKYAHVSIPEVTRRKLEQARKIIIERGETVSMNKLRIISGVHTTYALAYIQQEREQMSHYD